MAADANLHELPRATMTRTQVLGDREQKLDLITRNLTPQENAPIAKVGECRERHGA